jgi:hypothetical protein
MTVAGAIVTKEVNMPDTKEASDGTVFPSGPEGYIDYPEIESAPAR